MLSGLPFLFSFSSLVLGWGRGERGDVTRQRAFREEWALVACAERGRPRRARQGA